LGRNLQQQAGIAGNLVGGLADLEKDLNATAVKGKRGKKKRSRASR